MRTSSLKVGHQSVWGTRWSVSPLSSGCLPRLNVWGVNDAVFNSASSKQTFSTEMAGQETPTCSFIVESSVSWQTVHTSLFQKTTVNLLVRHRGSIPFCWQVDSVVPLRMLSVSSDPTSSHLCYLLGFWYEKQLECMKLMHHFWASCIGTKC